ncbi:MAG: hypothetical protein MK297_10465 [Planctomycetes bacterium]|nr:hypothetical protein [Planctomycetota bacterium]
MNFLLLIIIAGLGLVSLAIVISILTGRATQPMRVLLALILLGFTAFCSFGYLATYEPGIEGAMVFRVGYGGAIIASLYGVIRLLRGGRREG